MTKADPPPEAGFVVAIDGPAGSGKSTTAREAARRLGFRHLDSGALYRAVTLALLRAGLLDDPEGFDPAPEAIEALDLRLEPATGGFDVLLDGEVPGEALRSREVTRLVPVVARSPLVRTRLMTLQRSAAGFGGVVADGRDMGTVVFPAAPLKVFLTASLEERARRRLLQEGRAVDEASVRAEVERIRDRDHSDSARALAPLREAEGALRIDTTALDFEAQVAGIVEAARRRAAERGRGVGTG